MAFDVLPTIRRPWAAAGVAVISVLAFTALYLLVVGTEVGQYVDHEVMIGLSSAWGVEVPTSGWFDDVQVPLLLIGFAATAVLLAAGRSMLAVVEAAGTMVFTVGGAYLLKIMLDRPSFGVGPTLNSFPSNTVAIFAGLAAVAFLAAPSVLRSVVLLYALGVGAVASVAVVALQWHRPGDVLGAWLIAAGCAGAVRAACAIVGQDTSGRVRYRS